MIYLDTSALVKRFVAEVGSDRVGRLFLEQATFATAKIAYPEIYSGLTRKWRENALSRSDYELACREFELDWEAYIRVDLHDEILSISRDLIQRYPLRGFDAVHLGVRRLSRESLRRADILRGGGHAVARGGASRIARHGRCPQQRRVGTADWKRRPADITGHPRGRSQPGRTRTRSSDPNGIQREPTRGIAGRPLARLHLRTRMLYV